MSGNKSRKQPRLPDPEGKAELTDVQLDTVAGGVSLTYEKVQVVYIPQKAVGNTNNTSGDPDEGGQFRLR